jgi:hypothetical protein
MRLLILLAICVALGAVGGAITVTTLNRRDAYARGVMNVMQHHLVALRKETRGQRCEANSTAPALASLHELSADIEQVIYPEETADAPFREYAQKLRDAITGFPAAGDCPALAAGVDKIARTCDACHQQYR